MVLAGKVTPKIYKEGKKEIETKMEWWDSRKLVRKMTWCDGKNNI